ncbi:ribonuclease P protein component [Alkaliphilus transvaalensis]|uniref:ribonuclease P protein component n=1 Tax=Alkaliphilus transvaalensis TaxID=114628 RepID=UPI00047A5946|nr:ribonuclease P protein component [Alkaliphilus transvaalensis]
MTTQSPITTIRKDEEFRRVYKNSNSMANKLLIIYILKNQTEYNRVGFTVSKKVGKSVVRSRVKRLMKESYRLNQHRIKQGYDLVFVARNGCSTATYKEIESALLHLLKKKLLLN